MSANKKKRKGDALDDEPPAKRGPSFGAFGATTPDVKSGGLLQYQNQQLGNLMHEQRRTIHDLERKLRNADKRDKNREAELSTVRRAWDQLNADLSVSLGVLGKLSAEEVTAAVAEAANAPAPIDYNKDGDWGFMERLVGGHAYHAGKVDDELEKRCSALKQLAVRVASAVSEGVNTSDDELRALTSSLSTQLSQMGAALTGLQDRVSGLEDDVANVTGERDDAIDEVTQLTRRCDKLSVRCKEAEEEVARLRVEIESMPAGGGGGGGGAGPASGAYVDSDQIETLTTQMEVYKSLSQTRLTELEDMKVVREDMARKICALEAAAASGIDDQKVVNSPIYHALYHNYQHATRELEDMKSQAQRLEEVLALTERKGREQLEHFREGTMQMTEDLRVELQTATEMSAKHKAEADALRVKLAKVEGEKKVGGKSQDAASAASAAAAEHTKTLRAEMERARRTIEELRTKKAGDNPPTPAEADELASLSRDDLLSRALAIAGERTDAQNEIEELRAESEALVEEISALSEAFEDMQAQNEKVVAQLREQEDVQARMMSEQIKARQLHDLLREEKVLLEKKTGQLEETAHKQQQVLDKMTVRLQSLEEQLRRASEERFHYEAAVEHNARKARDAEEKVVQLQSQLSHIQNQKNEIEETAAKHAAEVESIQHDNRRLDEEASALRKKFNRVKSKEVAAAQDAALSDEIKLLKSLLNCTVCKVRQKDVVVTKCFHTFCRQCIQQNLAARNRKCPGCSTNYNISDVKSIYL